jgi:hypothetical protein
LDRARDRRFAADVVGRRNAISNSGPPAKTRISCGPAEAIARPSDQDRNCRKDFSRKKTTRPRPASNPTQGIALETESAAA